MVITEQKPITDTEKIKKKESKHSITKNDQITKEAREEERNRRITK